MLGLSLEFWQHQRELLAQSVCSEDSLGIFRRLFLNLPAEDTAATLVRMVGVVHVYTAAGIHLYALGAYIERTLRSWVQLRWIRNACWAGCVLVLWALTGFRWGLIRPSVILGIRALYRVFSSERPSFWVPLMLGLSFDLCLSALVFTAQGEEVPALLQWGRWHAVAAVFGGLLALEVMPKCKRSRLSEHLALSIGSWVLPTGLSLLLEGGSGVALLTPVLSLLTIPVICAVFVPIATTGLFLWFLGAQHLALSVVLRPSVKLLNHFVAEVSSPVLATPFFGILDRESLGWGALLAGCVTGLRLLRKWSRARSLWLAGGIVLLRAVGQVDPESFRKPDLAAAREVIQLNVRQGDSAFVRTSDGRVGLWDVGPRGGKRLAEWVAFFVHERVSQLDWVGFSHGDADHTGALAVLSRLIEIKCLDGPASVSQKTAKQGSGLESGSCVPFQTMQISESENRANGAMTGIVLPLSEGRGTFFSLGDADARSEKIFLASLLRANWPRPWGFKLSHHGSATSSSEEFLKRLHPDWVFLSVGRKNPFGHPSSRVLDRLERLGIPIRSTAIEGDLR